MTPRIGTNLNRSRRKELERSKQYERPPTFRHREGSPKACGTGRNLTIRETWREDPNLLEGNNRCTAGKERRSFGRFKMYKLIDRRNYSIIVQARTSKQKMKSPPESERQ